MEEVFEGKLEILFWYRERERERLLDVNVFKRAEIIMTKNVRKQVEAETQRRSISTSN